MPRTDDASTSAGAFPPSTINTTTLMRSFPHTLLVSIEGNIGAGKSTLLQALRVRNPSFHFIDEPVGIWQTLKNEAGESLLEVYYKDPKRWSYTFQSCALMSRFQSVSQAAHAVERSPSKQRTVVVTERCLDTDFHVFTKMLCEDGCINSMELEIYRRLYEHLQLSAIVHVDTAPPECLARIQRRARQGEDVIALDYLRRLDHFQRRWIDGVTIPTITTSSDAEAVPAVEAFLHTLLQK